MKSCTFICPTQNLIAHTCINPKSFLIVTKKINTIKANVKQLISISYQISREYQLPHANPKFSKRRKTLNSFSRSHQSVTKKKQQNQNKQANKMSLKIIIKQQLENKWMHVWWMHFKVRFDGKAMLIITQI